MRGLQGITLAQAAEEGVWIQPEVWPEQVSTQSPPTTRSDVNLMATWNTNAQ